MQDFKLLTYTPAAFGGNARQLDKPLVNRFRWIAPNPRFEEIRRKMKTDDTLRQYYARWPERLASERFTTAIDARLYMGASASAQTVYCSVWITPRDRDAMSCGYDSAGGYGYHKESQALEGALIAAGFKFSKGWGGSGESAMSRAIAQCGAKIGFRAGGLIL